MKNFATLSQLAAALALATAVPAFAADVARNGYAEALYADYARDADSRIAFGVETLQAGALTDIAGRSLESLVGSSSYLIEANDGPIGLSELRIGPVDQAKVNNEAFAATVDGFAAAGLPLDQGSYRLLDIAVAMDKQVQQHRAVEFCWSARAHCVVFDPNIEFLDSIVNGHRELRAQGYAPREERIAAPATEAVTARCGLASDPRYIMKSLTWGAYKRTYKNVYGITMVTKNLGGQQSGIRCTSSCAVAPFGYSNSSSAFANIPFSVDCGNAFGSGTTGRTGKFDAETKCSHRLTFSAKADASVANRGSASVDIKWDTTGSIDSNGGHMIDTCGMF
ncbi:hypothetical protein DFR29_106303 [Tahibacter aquaticus]|uniref:Uncharacterized protein n=1 Tax=Tahibacter aquaticus TaxID=520092 RepID=A0A4R6YYP9_9GAMM|nr:hypothetical protein [Tahibacter aquaticus]TDR44155.1 hypothetical protein DFR29_106303 [Tahibacter aquaticus]